MKALLTTVFIVLSTLLFAQKEREWKDINYVGDTLTGHYLDIYLPAKGDGPFPVIVSIAGSAWFSNKNKKGAYRRSKPLQEEGFAIVAVNHRSSCEAIFPAQINDIKAVVRFIRGKANIYNLDTRFIGITGNSSGGHLSALMGTSNGINFFTKGNTTLSLEGAIGKYTSESSHVDAVVDWYGPTDFQVMDSCGSKLVHDAIDSPESILTGGAIQDNDEMCSLANPITYIDENAPAFLILHGDKDLVVPHCQSILLHESLLEKGIQSKLIIVPGAGHGKGMGLPEYIDEMINFFNTELEKKLSKE